LASLPRKLGADGLVHHVARQLGSPVPLLTAVGAKTKRIKIAVNPALCCIAWDVALRLARSSLLDRLRQVVPVIGLAEENIARLKVRPMTV
jgi:hypothetical protein